MKPIKVHKPVLLREVIENLHIKEEGVYVDGTLGVGGHAKEIIKEGGFVIGLEADPVMFSIAKDNLSGFEGKHKLLRGNFVDIDKLGQVDGVLLDLGISTLHYSMDRGFSFERGESPLDMRLDPESQQLKASDFLNLLGEKELRELLTPKIAKKVLERRKTKAFRTVSDFLELFKGVKRGKAHPATYAFMALRIAVNSELENLKLVLPKSIGVLKSGGRLLIITFHSGEDRVVKNYFKKAEKEGLGKIITKKPITATREEVLINKSARSAKLRIFEKT